MVCPKCDRRIPKKSIFCLYCGSPVTEAAAGTESESERRYCILCGSQLPELGVSDVCESCLAGDIPDSGALLVPDLPDIPAESQPKSRGAIAPRIILIVFAAILIVAGIIFVPRLLEGSYYSTPKNSLSEKEQLALSHAQEMVKKAAFDPSSVHFEQLTVKVEVNSGVYTVSQSFERRIADGSTARSEYRATLSLDDSDGCSPLKLEVDGEVVFDSAAA